MNADRRRTQLAGFVEPHLAAGEEIRAILSRTGEPHGLLDSLGQLASLYGLADAVATHRALVVTDRRVFIVRMPWRRTWSIERVADRDAVTIAAFTPGRLRAGGISAAAGNLSLLFSDGRRLDLPFGFEGTDLAALQTEAGAVVQELGRPT